MDLYREAMNQWYVVTGSTTTSHVTPEDAFSELEMLGVSDDAIDRALTEMSLYKTNRARFTAGGELLETDVQFLKDNG